MNKNIIDIIYFSDDECVMTISFPYAWDDDGMTYIQDKINLYLHYVESNQLYYNYPNFKGGAVRIRVVYDIILTKDAEVFLNNLGTALNNINVLFDYFSTNESEQMKFG